MGCGFDHAHAQNNYHGHVSLRAVLELRIGSSLFPSSLKYLLLAAEA